MALHIHIRGIVQGVGFRPFVYRCALEHGICGWVENAIDGVHIHAEATYAAGDANAETTSAAGEASAEACRTAGAAVDAATSAEATGAATATSAEATGDQLAAFVTALKREAPAASRIENISVTQVPNCGLGRFCIKESSDTQAEVTLVSPDLATCPECVRELFDPNDRRYKYPFINCTNCGPRFTIIDALPYDRPKTSMGAFPMCPECADEYSDPANRRFHAQPDACFECGPVLSFIMTSQDAGEQFGIPCLEQFDAHNAKSTDELLRLAVDLLRAGYVLAIKGLGGYHLSCDANNPTAVARLRERKHRLAKPLAVMAPSIEVARRYCAISAQEEALLSSSVAPILLLQRKVDAAELTGLADGLPELGLMLPYTPVQHLLLRAFGDILVMTSGNISEEPIIGDDKEALSRLDKIADGFLANNREILSRYDDSIIRVADGDVTVVRRARGLAPAPLALPDDLRDVAAKAPLLAGGPEQKSTFALCNGKHVFVSQHLGDLENASTMKSWRDTRALYEHLFRIEPAQFACDMHPEYLSSKELRAEATALQSSLTEVQHHHAHIASVLGENDCRDTVVGIALDGTGFGTNSTIWGGEILIASRTHFTRVAYIEPFELPGGAAAVRRPARIAYGYLAQHDLLEHPGAAELVAAMSDDEKSLIPTMVARKLNSPLTSSAGRLMDMAAALAGVAFDSRYEGEAAILFEAAMSGRKVASAEAQAALDALKVARQTAAPAPAPQPQPALATQSQPASQPAFTIDPLPAIVALLDGKAAGWDASACSGFFHAWFCDAVVKAATQIARKEGLDTMALSGGCFANKFIYTTVKGALAREGFQVLVPKELPCNDGCISYGQTIVALARAAGSITKIKE